MNTITCVCPADRSRNSTLHLSTRIVADLIALDKLIDLNNPAHQTVRQFLGTIASASRNSCLTYIVVSHDVLSTLDEAVEVPPRYHMSSPETNKLMYAMSKVMDGKEHAVFIIKPEAEAQAQIRTSKLLELANSFFYENAMHGHSIYVHVPSNGKHLKEDDVVAKAAAKLNAMLQSQDSPAKTFTHTGYYKLPLSVDVTYADGEYDLSFVYADWSSNITLSHADKKVVLRALKRLHEHLKQTRKLHGLLRTFDEKRTGLI